MLKSSVILKTFVLINVEHHTKKFKKSTLRNQERILISALVLTPSFLTFQADYSLAFWISSPIQLTTLEFGWR